MTERSCQLLLQWYYKDETGTSVIPELRALEWYGSCTCRLIIDGLYLGTRITLFLLTTWRNRNGFPSFVTELQMKQELSQKTRLTLSFLMVPLSSF